MPEVHVRPLLAVAVVLAACTQAPPATPIGENPGSPPSAQPPADRSPTPANTRGVVIAETVAGGLVNPWAQDLSMGQGKIMRITSTGSAPSDNPFVAVANAQAIWSYGHRNVQSAALHPETGQLWTVEHGARGGDELNRPERGKNYGWPVITYGVDYSGARIGEGTTKAGLEQPVYYWDPVIAPSGMAFYTASAIPGWRGSVLIGSLSPGALVRLELTNGRVTRETRYLGELGERIRDVTVGPDGFVYLVTDSGNGRVLRVKPAAG